MKEWTNGFTNERTKNKQTNIALDIFAKIYYKNSAEGYVAPGKENESQEYLIRVQYY